MKQYEFEIKIKEMLKDVEKYTFNKCMHLFNCSGIDPEEFESNYRLPKIVLHAALKEVAGQYRSLTEEDREAAENLAHF